MAQRAIQSETVKHTPGPWSIRQNWRDKLAIVGPKNDGTDTTGDRICNLPHRGGEGRANARLIAAAPELLSYAKYMAANGDPDAEELVAKAST